MGYKGDREWKKAKRLPPLFLSKWKRILCSRTICSLVSIKRRIRLLLGLSCVTITSPMARETWRDTWALQSILRAPKSRNGSLKKSNGSPHKSAPTRDRCLSGKYNNGTSHGGEKCFINILKKFKMKNTTLSITAALVILL